MGLYLVAYPKDYITAVELFKKRKELESYNDDFIPNNSGIGNINVVHSKDLFDLYDTVIILNELKPKDIAYINLTITDFVYGSRLSEKQSVNIVKKHLAKAIESVGIDSKKFIFKTI